MADQTVWAVVAAFISGAGLDALRSGIAARQAKAARTTERQALFDDRQADFERATLLDYEEAMHKLTRLTAKAYMEYEKEYREFGSYGRNLLPDELGGDASRECATTCSKLSNRIIDDSIRASALKLQGMCSAVMNTFQSDAQNPIEIREQCRREFNQAMLLAIEMHTEIGRKLRDLYLRR